MICVCGSGIPCGPAHQVCSLPRSADVIPDQAVLHLQHSHHSAERLGVQPLHYLPGKAPEAVDSVPAVHCYSVFSSDPLLNWGLFEELLLHTLDVWERLYTKQEDEMKQMPWEWEREREMDLHWHIYFLFQMLATKFSGNFFVNLIGVWAVSRIFMLVTFVSTSGM